jgi:hypothetical protein
MVEYDARPGYDPPGNPGYDPVGPPGTGNNTNAGCSCDVVGHKRR